MERKSRLVTNCEIVGPGAAAPAPFDYANAIDPSLEAATGQHLAGDSRVTGKIEDVSCIVCPQGLTRGGSASED